MTRSSAHPRALEIQRADELVFSSTRGASTLAECLQEDEVFHSSGLYTHAVSAFEPVQFRIKVHNVSALHLSISVVLNSHGPHLASDD